MIIDDTHFEAVGYNKEKELFGYFVSEEQGYTVRVFPTLSYLRYAIPWDTVPNLIAWLREQTHEPLPNFQPRLAFMGDDGEKFGVWPGTYEHNWGKTPVHGERCSPPSKKTRTGWKRSARWTTSTSIRRWGAFICPPPAISRWASGRCRRRVSAN